MLLLALGCTHTDFGPGPADGGDAPSGTPPAADSDRPEVLGDAPPAPPDTDVLWASALPVFALSFADDDWASRLTAAIPADDCDERPYLEADLTFTNPATGAEERWPHVGVRYRGHSALWVPNHSDGNRWGFKLDFEGFSPGREFHGVETLNLLGTEGDTSLLRERVALEVMRASGVPAPLANHAWLVVNDEPLGLFPMVEEPDDRTFVEAHFPGVEGHLYKVAGYCHGTRMDYQGDDVDAYDGFEAKAGTVDADKATDLVPLFACLEAGSDDDVRACLAGAIDVEEWLAEIATDVYVRNVDGMAATGQNFLLFAPVAGPAVVYPYDLDLAWYGHEELVGASGIFDLRPAWKPSLPVLPVVLRERWQDDYCAAVLEVAEREGDALPARIRALEHELDDAMAADPFLSYAQWEDAVDDLVREVEARHEEVVRDATACEIPPPPPEPDPPAARATATRATATGAPDEPAEDSADSGADTGP